MIDTAIPAPPKWFADAFAVERQKTATRAAVQELPRLEADLAIMDGTDVDELPDGRTEAEVRAQVQQLRALIGD